MTVRVSNEFALQQTEVFHRWSILRKPWVAMLVPSFLLSATCNVACADSMRAIPPGKRPHDTRLATLRTTRESEFPMQPVADAAKWPTRRDQIRRRILVAAGLHPLPHRTSLNAVVHGEVERDDYTVERVFFESFPGHYVTGSLYRPKNAASGRRPAVLSPHGHWKEGRFDDRGPEVAQQEIQSGAEELEFGSRHVIQARCVQLARMGCVVFAYDMEGYADSVQLEVHQIGPRPDDNNADGYLLCSPKAELHGQTLFGLQTWNSICALDFVCSLDDVDVQRIAVTGASGGGTQTMILGAIDQRIAASMPAVMVSTAMQGGCVCENAQYLRIGQGNVDIAAATAPRPLGLICANDWTREVETKGHPELKSLYALLGHPEDYEAHFHLQFPHNYNAVNRQHMYHFMNRHLNLGLSEPILERDFKPLDVSSEATVWTDQYPKPNGDAVGQSHERQLTATWSAGTERSLQQMDEQDRRQLLSEGIATMVGRTLVGVGDVAWNETSRVESDVALIAGGTLTVRNHGEQLPTLWIRPQKKFNGQTVVWISDGGKGDAFGADGRLVSHMAELTQRGNAVVVIDMFLQGEFLEKDTPLESVPLVVEGNGSQPHHHAACFHFGFNPPLLVQRIHDVMSVVQFVGEQDHQPTKQIHLVAIGSQAGPVGLVAHAMLSAYLDEAIIDTQDFTFSSLSSIDHPMFLPGILRYGDIDTLWDLNHSLGATRVDGLNQAGDYLVSISDEPRCSHSSSQQDYQRK